MMMNQRENPQWISCATSSVKGKALLTAEELTFLINVVFAKIIGISLVKDAYLSVKSGRLCSNTRWLALGPVMCCAAEQQWKYIWWCVEAWWEFLGSRGTLAQIEIEGGGIDKHWVNPTMNARYSEEASFDTYTTQRILKFVCYYLPTICAKLLKQR